MRKMDEGAVPGQTEADLDRSVRGRLSLVGV